MKQSLIYWDRKTVSVSAAEKERGVVLSDWKRGTAENNKMKETRMLEKVELSSASDTG